MAPPATELTEGLLALDRLRLSQALELAKRSIGLSDPNPRVGCVIGTLYGHVIATGFTQAAGSAHAEAHALQQAALAGASTHGATAWVTLEPCSHHGRTPPCCDALIAAGISRVVYAMQDPNAHVNGSGLARLRAAGVDVVEGEADLAARARDLNVGFAKRMQQGLPWVRVKIAASLDAVTALPSGESQWITSPAAREDNQAWRRRAGAIVTGIGTVLADDPRMTVRSGGANAPSQPLRVVVDSRLRLPPHAQLLAEPGPVLVATLRQGRPSSRFAEPDVKVLELPPVQERVDLGALVQWLATQEVNEVHVEAGPTLGGAFMQQGLVDELLIYLAPCLLNSGRRLLDLPAIERLNDRLALDFRDVVQVGPDIRIRASVGSATSGLARA